MTDIVRWVALRVLAVRMLVGLSLLAD